MQEVTVTELVDAITFDLDPARQKRLNRGVRKILRYIDRFMEVRNDRERYFWRSSLLMVFAHQVHQGWLLDQNLDYVVFRLCEFSRKAIRYDHRTGATMPIFAVEPNNDVLLCSTISEKLYEKLR